MISHVFVFLVGVVVGIAAAILWLYLVVMKDGDDE